MFNDWIQSMVLYLILAGLSVNMSPSNQYKQYIRYFTGLVVIVVLATPISYLFHLGSGEFDEVIGTMAMISDGGSGLMKESVLDVCGLYDYYDAGLRMSMKQDLFKYGVTEVELVTDEEEHILKCIVYLDVGKDSGQKYEDNEIKKYICDVYNVEEPRIYVVRR